MVACLVGTLACRTGSAGGRRPDVSPVVTVTFAEGGTPFTTSGYGILLGLSPKFPPDEFITPLKPSLLRFGNLSTYRRAKDHNAQFMCMLFGDFEDPTVKGRLNANAHWPGDGGDWASWENFVTRMAEQARGAGWTDVIWEPWNEPDINYFWKRSYRRFLETYEHAVKAVRRVIPDAVVTGPSLARFNESKIIEFLEFSRERGVLPDVINWHEIPLAPNGIPGRVNRIRAYLKKNNINITRFMLPEITEPRFQFSPGNAVAFIANIHRAGVEASAKSCWADPDEGHGMDNCLNASLDGLLRPGRKPRSIWWCYRAYGSMSGRLLPVDFPPRETTLDGIATYDGLRQKGCILVGRTQSNHVLSGRARDRRTQHVVVKVKGIPDSLTAAGAVRLKIMKIEDSEARVSSGPVAIQDALQSVSGSELLLALPDMGGEDVYYIELSRP